MFDVDRRLDFDSVVCFERGLPRNVVSQDHLGHLSASPMSPGWPFCLLRLKTLPLLCRIWSNILRSGPWPFLREALERLEREFGPSDDWTQIRPGCEVGRDSPSQLINGRSRPPKSSLTETNDLLLRDLARGRVRAPGLISGEGRDWSLMS
jgi:hypothetical protein